MAKPRSIAIERWTWSDRSGPGRLERELVTRGIARIHMPDAAEASHDPHSLFFRLFGSKRGLLRSARYRVRPEPGQSSVVRNAATARPHIDDDELMPANVQILCCVRQSRRGGDSVYVDSWSVLERIERDDRALFRALFEVPRVFHYVDMNPVRPTFSLRYGNLVFSHAPGPTPDDEFDRRIAEWIERVPKYRFRAERGDICVINHQRMLHGRDGFSGPRELVRVLYWFSKGLPGPARYLARARRFGRRLALHNANGPTWVREWLQPSDRSRDGLVRLAAVLAYMAGENAVDVCRRAGVSARVLELWTARAVSVAAAALGEPEIELAKSQAAIQRQVLEVIDGLLSASPPRTARAGRSRAPSRRSRRRARRAGS